MTQRLTKPADRRLAISAVVVALALAAQAAPAKDAASSAGAFACPAGDTGITLSPGFCATVFADNLGHVRH
ncbi:MAG TPA: hypothetical protein VKP60_19330, partial [Magnetospirillaceae bacterium]|nr:hypothetical protein [Magnetospirillaceae bacterium]